MSLQNLLDLSSSRSVVKDEVSEERLRQNLDNIRKEIAFYREYPDLFIDFLLIRTMAYGRSIAGKAQDRQQATRKPRCVSFATKTGVSLPPSL